MVLPLAIPMLTVPGLYGSEDEHWQSYWEREYPQVTRVAQADWKGEDRQAWLANLEAAVALIEAPLVLVAHSRGCILVAHWAAQSPAISKVKAAFLVAPPDLDADHFPSPATQAAFSPVPQAKLPFPSQVIASRSRARSAFFASSGRRSKKPRLREPPKRYAR